MKKTVKTILTVVGFLFVISTVGCEVKYGGNFFPAMLSRIVGKKDTVKLEQYNPTNGWVIKTADEVKKMERVTGDDSLILINTENRLKEDYEPCISEYKTSELMMNDCIQNAYEQLSMAVLSRCEDRLYVSSAYRTGEEQKLLHEQDPKTSAEVGASEHQAGLALDVYVQFFAGKSFIKSQAGKYVEQNAHKYGFIVRYPKGKTDITGIEYEPWHIRYVGAPHASIMFNNNLAFEEYLEKLEVGKIHKVTTAEGTFFIERAEADSITVPASGYTKMHISPDNMGNYIVTISCE